MKKKIAHISCDTSKGPEWVADYVKKENFNTIFILLSPDNSELERYLKNKNIMVYRIKYKTKKDLFKATVHIFIILKKEKVQIIHAHLFDATLAGLLAAFFAGISKRIYSRHHSSYHHRYFPSAVKYDRFCNYLSTDIIAPSKNVEKILVNKEHVKPYKVHLIHHGFKLEAFENIDNKRIEFLRNRYNVNNHYPVLGVVSRYIHWKGIQYIIPAFKKLLTIYPTAYLILANANGNYRNEIQQQLKQLPFNSYIEIPFEKDIFALYKLFDIFLHVPINDDVEAFGQVYVEALAAGVPSIFTISGIASEFIRDKKNAIVVKYENSDAIYEAIIKLVNDSKFKKYIVEQGKRDIKLFEWNRMIQSLNKLYDS